MKKVILAAAALFVLNTVNAQEPVPSMQKGGAVAHPKKEQGMKKETVEQRAQKAVDKINEAVSLTEDQKPKIYAMALTKVKNVEAIREKYKGQKEQHTAMEAEIKEVRKAFRKDAKTVLTPEQLEKAKTFAKANKAGKEENGLDAQD